MRFLRNLFSRRDNATEDSPSSSREALDLIKAGQKLEDQGLLKEAARLFAAAIELSPHLAVAHLNLGNVLLALESPHAAIEAYNFALRIDPEYAAAHFNIGNANARLSQYGTALKFYEEATRLKPDFLEAIFALATMQYELGLLGEAEISYRHVLRLKPEYSEAWFALGSVLRGLGKPEARSAFLRACNEKVDFGEALAFAFHSANELCDWSNRRSEERQLEDMVVRGVVGIPPFIMLNAECQGEAGLIQLKASLMRAERSVKNTKPHPASVGSERAESGCLRIGYLSADFHRHATMHLLRGVLTHHNRAHYSIYAYSLGDTNDEMTAEVARNCEQFTDLSRLSDTEAANVIASDRIDILVDLKGFTTDARVGICAQRPAPVIVNWLGYPGTLGHPLLADYIVGDPIVTPLVHATHFSEVLALMPNCYQPNDNERLIGPKPTRFQAGLPESGFVFCSFNQSHKFAPQTFDVWCRLLTDVPDSILWLLPTSGEMVSNLRRESATRGVDGDRLIFGKPLSQQQHLGRLQLADLALDTYPCNSHTTASDALWAGVPLITRIGNTFAGRVAASLLQAAGLPELVTKGWDDYFELARLLALDDDALKRIRIKLASNVMHSPLFATLRFTRDLERLYERIWEQHKDGVRAPICLSSQGPDALHDA